MIIPDKFTPFEKSYIYKSMQLYSENPNGFISKNCNDYDNSIFKDIDEYIKVLTLLYTLGILKESEDNNYDSSNQ